MKNNCHFLRELGVYGFDHIEPLILASLVSGDPLLLIGKAGTGKTFLLNSISEALGLDHRHYNASFISFDDLIGFPYPDKEGREVLFLRSPATIWDAESVLVDEISRCKPEIQNKFFSIIHEKKIQGISLDKLLYRWAAMNPLFTETGSDGDNYDGSISLDQALADRFAFIIDVPDWEGLTIEEQNMVIDPSGEGVVNSRSDELISFVEKLKPVFLDKMKDPGRKIVDYCRIITTLLGDAGYRISPRRARLLARNLISTLLVASELGSDVDQMTEDVLFKLCITWSIPHRAWKGSIPSHIIDVAHAECMRQISQTDPGERWLQDFLNTNSLNVKLSMLIMDPGPMEVKSLALLQFLHNGSRTDTAIFAFASQPLIQSAGIVDDEALAELTKKATAVLNINGEMKWRAMPYQGTNMHPMWSDCVNYISNFPDNDHKRKTRAKQLFLYLIINDEFNDDPEFTETRFNDLFSHVRDIAAVHIKE